jgi:hypothetical protein
MNMMNMNMNDSERVFVECNFLYPHKKNLREEIWRLYVCCGVFVLCGGSCVGTAVIP